jgi:hypothetical protein
VVFTGLAVTGLFFLAAGLSQLEFLPGLPLPMLLEQEAPPDGVGTLPGGDAIFFILRVVYLIGLILLPFFVIYLVINPKARKKFLKELLRIGSFALMMYFIFSLIRSFDQTEKELGGEAGGGPQGGLPSPELVEFIPKTPAWLVNTLAVLLALLIVGLIGVLLWVFLKRKPAELPLRQIAEEAQSALDAIRAGGDLRNIVLRCYAEMSRVLSERRGIQRPPDMTPREFEIALERQGLPREPVQALTRLFEEVRYGAITPGKGEEQRALDSLAAIVQACGNPDRIPDRSLGGNPV